MSNTTSREFRDLRASIVNLQNSTSSTEAYAETLERYLSSRRQRVHADQSIQSNIQLDGLEQRLVDSRTSLLNQQRVAANTLQRSVRDTINGTSQILSHHDRILLDLDENQEVSLDIPSYEARVNDLLLTLEKTHADILTVRLERRFLTARIDASLDIEASDTQEDTWLCDAVRDDLRLLYNEIDEICQILVNHQHRNDLHMAMNDLTSSYDDVQENSAEQISKSIMAMTIQLNQLAEYVETLQSHRQFVQHVDEQHKSIDISDHALEATCNQMAPKTTRPAKLKLEKYLGVDTDLAPASISPFTAVIAGKIDGSIREVIDSNQRHRNCLSNTAGVSDDHKTLLEGVNDLVAQVTARLDSGKKS